MVESTWRVRGRKVKPPALVLRAGSPAQADWLELIDLAVDLLESNHGVDIAPQLTFPVGIVAVVLSCAAALATGARAHTVTGQASMLRVAARRRSHRDRGIARMNPRANN